MNGKAFRRNPGPKQKSASSTFISLHFNKSDEDQLEISYKNDKKVTGEPLSQSNFYVADSKKSPDNPYERILPEVSATKIKSPVHPTIKSFNELNALEDLSKGETVESSPCDNETSSSDFRVENNVRTQDECDLKLSPAVEVAEVIRSDSFNHYINEELEKAKCLTLHSKKEFSPSENHAENLPTDSELQHNADVVCSKEKNNSSGFCFVVQNGLVYARNSVKFHLMVAVFACVCAPIPSWLSGFLVGVILACSLVCFLYKPQKNKRKNFPLHFAAPAQTPDFQKESGILKDWMNELPSPTHYTPETYHVSCTRSVYVRLEGSYLRLSLPQKNIPKRAMFNEPRFEMQFIHQQHYDITDASVELLPSGLSNKRLWSKKYPICLRIANCKQALLAKTPQETSAETKANKKENFTKKFTPRINENNEIVVYLFPRTDRDKSLWYSRFLRASRMKTENESFEKKRSMSAETVQIMEEVDGNFVNISFSKQQKFEMYMSALLAPSGTEQKDIKNQSWLNVLIGRLFFDFLIEEPWAQLVSEKVQKKLNRIKLPFFLSELIVKDIHLGSALPKVLAASEPSTDERGLWIDVNVSYEGSFHMTLETKLNLHRLKVDSEAFFSPSDKCNSDEDSLESSSDDDESLLSEVREDREGSLSSGGSTSKKLLKFVDKLAQSSYFQQAAKNKYVKKAMDDLSNTPLLLTVEVQWLTGLLAINIPPWPTDRLWYGFRSNPSLSITARPKLGQHVVTLTHITEWIEKKLTSEFQKVLVMPNMDDLIIPIMSHPHTE